MERLYHTSTLEKVRRKPIKKEQEMKYVKKLNSPVGPLTLVANDQALLSLSWCHKLSEPADNGDKHPILLATEIQLEEYFTNKRTSFDIPLAPEGTTFQKSVWEQLLKIPFGKTITYGEQARRLGKPKSVRAVGAANGKNPIGIIVPCHRVLGASGDLTGFAGGLEIKRKLLRLEGLLLA